MTNREDRFQQVDFREIPDAELDDLVGGAIGHLKPAPLTGC